MNFLMFKLVLEKAEEPEIKLPTSIGSSKKQESFRKTSDRKSTRLNSSHGAKSRMPISVRIFQFIVIHIVKGFGIVNKAEIDVFLKLSCFFDDPADVGNLISGSFAL